MSSKKNKKVMYHYDMELDLHGCNAEDAIVLLDRTILANENSSIMVIHGKGSGILRRAVRDFLKGNRFVRDVHYGEDINIIGADGITVVYTL
ncbi:MAG: hypothetical protein A2017_13315 [Lentisphaerae bacterium GWF2_44_16]|nr:MAG: hypothetical protein A2017_13315 [Lentisphaerae bacterium GWF2_44_16]